MGHSGHQCSHAPGRPILRRRLISRGPRWVAEARFSDDACVILPHDGQPGCRERLRLVLKRRDVTSPESSSTRTSRSRRAQCDRLEPREAIECSAWAEPRLEFARGGRFRLNVYPLRSTGRRSARARTLPVGDELGGRGFGKVRKPLASRK
jgi:hypothetical protein